jgi:transposase
MTQHQEREKRRLKALAMFRGGMRWADVGKAVRVSRTTVSRWSRRVASGESMEARKQTGRPPDVSLDALKRIVAEANVPPRENSRPWVRKASSGAAARWTGDGLAQVIRTKTGVKYSADYCGRLLKQLRGGT